MKPLNWALVKTKTQKLETVSAFKDIYNLRQDYRSQSFRHKKPDGKGSKWARLGPLAYQEHQLNAQW